MKKLLLMLLLATPALAVAQTQNITSLYKSYSDRKGVTTIMMGPEMLGSSLRAGKPLESSMFIISAERSLSFGADDLRKLREQAAKMVSAPGYKVIMDVKDDDEIVRIYARDGASKDELRDVTIIISEADEVTVIGISGKIPADMVGRLSSVADQDD